MIAKLSPLEENLQPYVGADRFIVGFSGGCDSTALLHAVVQSYPGKKIIACHIQHGLQSEALAWQRHCLQICLQWQVALWVIPVKILQQVGDSIEENARKIRYKVFASLLQPGDVLLTAHHADDQAETLLLQLMRGAGPKGLAGMPICKVLGSGYHVRPLLSCTRDALISYSKMHALTWIEDSSNKDVRFSRNYLRHEILPLLRARWPQLAGTISRSAELCAREQQVLNDYLAMDYQHCFSAETGSVSALLLHIKERRYLLLRLAFEKRGLAMPSQRQLLAIDREILQAKADASPQITLKQVVLRRYRDTLYFLPVGVLEKDREKVEILTPSPSSTVWERGAVSEKGAGCWEWPHLKTLLLPMGDLSWQEAAFGIAAVHLQKKVEVRFRVGGERIFEQGHHHLLKKYWQIWGVPPWLRAYIPLIFIDEVLACVPGYKIVEQFAAKKNELAYNARWQWNF